MNGRTHQQGRTGAFTVDDLYGCVDWCMGVQRGTRQVELQAFTGLHPVPSNLEGSVLMCLFLVLLLRPFGG